MATIDDLEEVKVTAKRRGDGISSLKYLSFPMNLAMDTDKPYVLLKIYEVKRDALTAEETAADRQNQSLNQSIGNVGRLVENIANTSAGKFAIGSAIAAQLGLGSLGTTATGAAALSESLTGVIAGQIDEALKDATGNAISIQGIGDKLKSSLQNFNMKRNVSRVSTAIALPMPENIASQYDQAYQELSMTQVLGAYGAIGQAMSAKGQGLDGGTDPYVLELATSFASKLPGVGPNADDALFFGTTGLVVNPQMEMVYTSPMLRQFVLNFMLTPKNAKEAEILYSPNIEKGIISMLKYYSVPDIPKNTTGRYFIPPAQFEIEFWNTALEPNRFLFKTKKCVLAGLSVDYTPGGFATHKDGTPAQVAIQLQFKETAILSKEDIKNATYR